MYSDSVDFFKICKWKWQRYQRQKFDCFTGFRLSNTTKGLSASMMADQQFFLKWNDFQTNMVTSFRHLRDEKSFTDVSIFRIIKFFSCFLFEMFYGMITKAGGSLKMHRFFSTYLIYFNCFSHSWAFLKQVKLMKEEKEVFLRLQL